ncbi:hypothetical protein QJS10_CPB13g00964 [Acorus calamus]|uniref:Uncharacterized protein n=1 Tax=Acorus calamus TaxID=4465 RepID=A0AAV9DIW0_ACOCL|nr:hypothetical protein QJS10_CPB13g00964 [Acorus calamus]
MSPKPRIPQTASTLRRQSKRLTKDVLSTIVIPYIQEVALSSQNVEVELQEEDEREKVEVEVDSDIDEGSMKGPFPGGPETNELLIDYRHYVAYRIWNGKLNKVYDVDQSNIGTS